MPAQEFDSYLNNDWLKFYWTLCWNNPGTKLAKKCNGSIPFSV